MPRDTGGTPIPTAELAAPARRALDGAGYTTLEQLEAVREADVAELHGVGPSTVATLRELLEARDLSFRGGE
ncbi:DNA-binding protein [Halorarum halophilum]|uniref:DNA-binding protein n=1 Tax=Halorarum halophilum TaxID=2743090 RepID=A0A7D5GYV3_9EURY|nr:DNA-binding protein [Halobaculum halophilum]QLG28989.1 DNA-binding protein [Halobaculum halophilum]